MAQIGDLTIPDELMPTMSVPAAPRPSIGAVFSGAAQSAFGQVRYGLPYAAERLTNTLTPTDETFFKQGLARYDAAGNAAPAASVDDVLKGRVGVGRFVAENLASSVPQSAAIIAGGVGGALLGGPVGAVAGSIAAGTPTFVGSNVDRAVQETGGLSQEAATRAVLSAPVQAASEALIERYLPGAGHVIGDFAAHQTGNFLARTAKSIVKAGATEAVAEAGQQLGERYSAGLDVTGPQAAAEYVNAAVTAFAVGGVLGAGGGFRRGPAHVKNATDVTTDDLSTTVDSALAGTQRSLPSPDQQLALPAPDPTKPMVQQRADLVADPRGNIAPNTPAGQAALAAAPVADIVTDAAGNSITSPTAADLARFRNTPVDAVAPTLTPDIDAFTQRFGQQAAPALPLEGGVATEQQLGLPFAQQAATQETPASALPQLPLDANLSTVPPETQLSLGDRLNDDVTDTSVRVLQNAPIDQLNSALRGKGASPEVQAEAQREITQRTAEALGTAPLTTDNFQQRVDELKSGLRGSFVTKLTASDPVDLRTKLYNEIFENQNTAASVTTLAQRAGLLDENLNPTEAANQIEAQRTAEAQAAAAPAAPVGTPVGTAPLSSLTPADATQAPASTDAVSLAPQAADPAFAPEWEKLKTDAGITRLRGAADLAGTPPNIDAARAQVFDALANDALTRSGEASQVERLARKLGLVTDDESMDVTPLGRRTYLMTPAARDEIEVAKRQQGFAGTQAAAFDQGVQAEATGAPSPAYSSFEDLAAHEAGKVWAKDVVDTPGPKSIAQTRAIQGRQAARTTGTAVAREQVQRTELTPGQVQQRSLNRLLDAVDLRSVNDTDAAALRRMVRDGASTDAVAQAIQQVQGGKTLFQQPDPRRSELSTRPSRGQPIFREMAHPEEAGTNRAQTEAAVRAYGLRNLVEFARTEGGITDARAQKLHDMLDQGKVEQVARSLKDFEPDDKGAAARLYIGEGGILGGADGRLEQAITGKTFAETLDHMVENAPSADQRALMSKVRSLAQEIAKAGGHEFDIRIAKPGDAVPTALANPDVRAYTQITTNPAKATVWLKGVEMGPESGVNYQLAAHEMLHAVTLEAMDYARTSDPEGKTALGRHVRDLENLSLQIVRHLHDRLDNGDRLGLSPFELSSALQEHNAFSSADEIVSWGLTNPEMQRYLQGIEFKPRQSVFSRLLDLVRGVLGLPTASTNALQELTRVSEAVLGTKARELAPVFARNDPNGLDTRVLQASARAGGVDASNRTVTAANDAARQAADVVGKVAERVNLADLSVKARRVSLGWFSQNHIDRTFGDRFPAMLARTEAKRQHDAVRGRFASMGDQAYQRFEALQRSSAQSAERLGKLMATTTEFRVDPDKAFDEHTHLQGDPNTAALRRLHAEAVKMKNDLSRGDGAGYKLYTEFRQWNETMNYARLASELHSLVALDPELSLGVAGANVNPMDTFMTQADLASPEDIRSHWQGALNAQIAAAQQFVNTKRGEMTTLSATEQRAIGNHLSPIEAKIASTHEALAGMARAPYFHLGRFGDNYGSATIRKNADGTVDPKAQAHVAQALADAGFRDVQISTDNTRPKFSARFDTVDQTNRFKALMLDLHKQGWMDGDAADIQAGPRERADNYGVADGLPAFVQRYISAIEQNPMFAPSEGMNATERAELAKRKEEAVQLARDTWLEQQPDSAIAKVLTARYTVPGYNPDMIRNFSHRWNVGSTNLASVATSAKVGNAFRDMRAQVAEARSATSTDDAFLRADLLTEMHKRDATNPVNPVAGTFDKLRSVSHAYYLGLSPAYAAIQIMQIGTNAIPELAKTHGFGQSFHAMRRASTQAFALMRAATAEAAKGGWEHYADVALTETALKNAGLPKGTTDFMRRMIATGSIDIGQSANALSQIARNGTGSKLDVGLKYASAMGLHTETFSRLVTALAAHDLHGGDDVEAKAAYAQKVVSNSMFDYQSWNSARQLGKQGFAGPITPLLTQFMTYSAQMTEKLYTEAASAIGKVRPGESVEAAAERASASRTFLLGHLTAITALAGTLGLPFASVFATVIEKLVNTAGGGDEPYDATASWRNFLASVLGKDVGEVVARGAPRALGADISSRVGEQDLLPFSSLLTDKRGWREAIQSATGRATGAAPDMLLNLADAGASFGNGDLLGGMKAMLPVAFKAPVEAYRMSTEGYIDSKGQKLPLTPGARDIMWQLLGFTPSDKAEYSEARGDQQSRRVALNVEAAGLRGQIVRAMTTGDTDRARELVAKAQTFDKANPSFAVIPSLAGAVQRQQASQARARALQTPLGVPQQDIAGQHLTGYANVNYQ